MNLSEVKDKPISELVEIATELGLQDVGRLKKTGNNFSHIQA